MQNINKNIKIIENLFFINNFSTTKPKTHVLRFLILTWVFFIALWLRF